MHDEDQAFSCPYCDRRFLYKPQLEGKRIRCKCGEKFTVESPLIEEPDPYSLGDNPENEDNGPDLMALLSSAGGDTAPAAVQAASQSCPGCGAAVKPGAALCVQCGTDLKSGKKRGNTAVSRDFNETHASTASAVRTKVAGVGLMIHGLGYLGMMASIVMFFIGSWGTGGAAGPNGAEGWQLAVAGVLFITGIPALVLGPFLCLAVPKEAGLFFLIGAIGLYLLAAASLIAVGMDMIPLYLQNLTMLPQVFAAGCFVGFMRQLAEFLNAGSVYENTEFLLKVWKYIAITGVLLVLPFVGCLAVIVFLVAQIIFSLTYGWIVCQAGLAAIRS